MLVARLSQLCRRALVLRGISSSHGPSEELAATLRSAQAFCFDVDSTVITEEGECNIHVSIWNEMFHASVLDGQVLTN